MDNEAYCKLRDLKRSDELTGGVYHFDKWLNDVKSQIPFKDNWLKWEFILPCLVIIVYMFRPYI